MAASTKGGPQRPPFSFEGMRDVIERVWEIAEPVVAEEGLEIVDIEYHREGRGMVLRFYLDRLGGTAPGAGTGGVGLDELTRVSRQLGDLLDVRDAVPGSYVLECSSPGINRRLRRPDHFRRYLGKRVRVRTTAPVDGRRSFTGCLVGVDPAAVIIEVAGQRYSVRFVDIAQASYEAGPEEFKAQEVRRCSPN